MNFRVMRQTCGGVARGAMTRGMICGHHLKRWAPLAITPVFLWLLFSRLSDLDPADVWTALEQLGPGQWVAAAVVTVAGYLVVGQYDVLAHRILRSGYASRDTLNSGMAAIAIGQVLGGSAVTSALVRWRLLGGASAALVAQVSGLVAVSFLSGWAVVAAIAVVATPVAPGLFWVSLAVLALAAALVAYSLALRSLRLWGREIRLPSLRYTARIFSITAVDLLATAAVLAILLPAQAAVPFPLLFGAFILALGAGLISNTPGGLGPFELTLLALLPTAPPAPLLAGVLAFRVVYYVLPALVAAAYVMTRAPAQPREVGFETAPHGRGHREALQAARRAEAQLVRQGNGFLLGHTAMNQRLVCHQSSQCYVMLGDPVSGDCETALTFLRRGAKSAMTTPVIYKCGAAMAETARASRWATTPIAEEAWLTPATFTTQGSRRRQLRRKLRKAESAQVIITQPAVLPWADMARVAAQWASANGGERGLSTGQFDPDYLSNQRIYLAHVGTTLAGFVTFHTAGTEWTLDLVRVHAEAPDGTIHALIEAALRDAATREVPRLSLAAVPYSGEAPKWQRSLRRFHTSKAQGLRQFKACFDPEWEVLYAAAPHLAALIFGLVDVARDVRYPNGISPGQKAQDPEQARAA